MEKIKKEISKIKESEIEIGREVKEKTVGYILAALGLVAGLAWNEAIKSIIDQFFPSSGNSILIKFMYAVLVTLLVVVVSIYLIKFTNKKKD